MIYTCVDEHGRKQTYEGFVRSDCSIKGESNSLVLVVAWFEDTFELWYLDTNNPIALDELNRYYRSEGYAQGVTLQVWKNFQTSVVINNQNGDALD